MDRAIALIKAVEKPLIHYIHPKNMKNAFRAFFLHRETFNRDLYPPSLQSSLRQRFNVIAESNAINICTTSCKLFSPPDRISQGIRLFRVVEVNRWACMAQVQR